MLPKHQHDKKLIWILILHARNKLLKQMWEVMVEPTAVCPNQPNFSFKWATFFPSATKEIISSIWIESKQLSDSNWVISNLWIPLSQVFLFFDFQT